ncbi:MAG: hypothetical protein M1483_06850 [Actinobacteria bacterium]|nr:hypothetical protein [Actinomycetota bacterium]MCL6105326.1 hypothetical protein [Actinomycetota bacterium]
MKTELKINQTSAEQPVTEEVKNRPVAIRLVVAEFTKVKTARMTYGLLVGSIVITALAATAILYHMNKVISDNSVLIHGINLGSPTAMDLILSSATAGVICVLALGILGMAGEYRHNTAVSTFLITPKRSQVVVAKMVCFFVMGVIFGIIDLLIVISMALPWLHAMAVRPNIFNSNVTITLICIPLATGLYGMIAVSLGSLIRNQVAALIVALAWTMIVEKMIIVFLPEIGRWLPVASVTALIGLSNSIPGITLLTRWQGGVVFALYGVVFAIIGTKVTIKRDV